MSLISSIGKAVIGKGIKDRSSGKGVIGLGLGIVAARIATRSVPGALLIGGAYLAKKLYDQKVTQGEAERLNQPSLDTPVIDAIEADTAE